MKRGRNIFLSGCFLPLFHCAGQNLVPNSGFENSVDCTEAVSVSTIENCTDWFNSVEPLTSVDWYSDCFCAIPGSLYCPPNLFYGFANPNSGNAMVGFGPYNETLDKGESMGVRLIEPLTADSAYCFNFWIKNSQNHNNNYSMFEFDVAFVQDTANIDSKQDITDYSTAHNTIDNGEWQQISSYYIANGGEEFMLIGVFNPVPNYHVSVPQTNLENRMYYYLDDVSVTLCNKDSLLSVILELPNVFSPNYDLDNPVYRIKRNNIATLKIQVMNRWGNLILEYDGLTTEWDGIDSNGNPAEEGVYFVQAIAETTSGEIFSKQQFVHLFR